MKCIYCGSEEVEKIEFGDWFIPDENITPLNPDDYHTMECQDCAQVFLVQKQG